MEKTQSMNNSFGKCSSCEKTFPVQSTKKAEFITKKREAERLGLEILESLDNPHKNLVLVNGLLCSDCFEGATEKV